MSICFTSLLSMLYIYIPSDRVAIQRFRSLSTATDFTDLSFRHDLR